MHVVLFGHVQVEGLMLGIAREAAEVGVTAVADGDLGQQRVEERVDEGGHHEARVVRREGGEDRAQGHDRQARLLVEIALDVEERAAASGTGVDDARLTQRAGYGQRRRFAARPAMAVTVDPGRRFPPAVRATESDLRSG